MLKIFRQKNVARKVLWVVTGIIVISFGFGFGISRYGAAFDVTRTAGKVYGRSISLKEYQKNYQNVHDQAVMLHGADVERILPMMDLENETWSRIILLKAAEQKGLKAVDGEVIQFVANTPYFQRDGQFDKGLYANIVKNIFRREPRDFEEGLRDQIKIMKLFSPAIKAISFSDEKVRQEYERRNQKMQVNYILISPEAFTQGITATDEDLRRHFDARREDFQEPETMKVMAISLPLDAKASPADKAAVTAKAKELRAQITAGTDAAVAAKQYNATVKETEFFSVNAPSKDIVPSFELLQGLFSAKAGDVLEPAEGADSVQVVKVLEKKPAFVPEFTAIKEKVSVALIKEKAGKIAEEKAAAVLLDVTEKIKGGLDFVAAVRAASFEPKQTAFFGLGEYVAEIGMSEDFTTAAFALNKDTPLSGVVKTSKGPAILSWLATQPADEKKFSEVKKDFTDSLYSEERVHVMNALIKTLREQAQLTSYLGEINAKQKDAIEKMRIKK